MTGLNRGHVDHRPIAAMCAALVLCALLALLVSGTVSDARTGSALPDATSVPERLQDACDRSDPYFATSLQYADRWHGDRAAVAAVRDSATDDFGDSITLATTAQVGAVHGLAFDAGTGHLYVSSYFKRGTAYGPGGPGTIYRIDTELGDVSPFASVVGPIDRHDHTRGDDEAAARNIGKIGLGDIDVGDTNGDGAADTLFVANTSLRRIERVAIPSGAPLSGFSDGARGTLWSRDARLFGLAWHDSWIYHGVIDSRENEGGTPSAHVYRSKFDGSDMEAVLSFPLDIPWSIPWGQWSDPPVPWSISLFARWGPAQPMLTDLEFSREGDMILGLRDRWTDMIPAFKGVGPTFGIGDILLAPRSGTVWNAPTTPAALRRSIDRLQRVGWPRTLSSARYRRRLDDDDSRLARRARGDRHLPRRSALARAGGYSRVVRLRRRASGGR